MKFSVSREGDQVTYTTRTEGTAAATVITANPTGVTVEATWGVIRREMDMEDFLITLRKAWAHHNFLVRNMVNGAILDEVTAQRIAVDRQSYSLAQLSARTVKQSVPSS